MKVRTWLNRSHRSWVRADRPEHPAKSPDDRRRRQVVVITRWSRGSAWCSRAVVERGARVAICARDADELARARRELDQPRRRGSARRATHRSRDVCAHREVEDDFGAIDVLINNAGNHPGRPLEHMTADDSATRWRQPARPLHATPPCCRDAPAKGRPDRHIASIGGKVAVPHSRRTRLAVRARRLVRGDARRADQDGIYVTTCARA